jgi:hypothetical protein
MKTKQAKEFLNRYEPELSARQKGTLIAFINLPNQTCSKRKYLIIE